MITFPRCLTLLALATALLVFTGCGRSGSGGASVDPAPIEKAFAPAEAALKDAANKAVEAIKKADYSSALAELQKLAGNVKLTDEQKSAINSVIEQVKKALAGSAEKVDGEANKAVGEMQKTLGK